MNNAVNGVMPTADEWQHIAAEWSWSERECHVVRLLAAGEPRKNVAASLKISLSTLQTHLRRALWKAGAGDLIGLLWAIVARRDSMRSERDGPTAGGWGGGAGTPPPERAAW